MNIQEEIVVRVVDQITNQNGAPCKKTLQKIIYLISEAGLDIGFAYGIHFYGPYSSELDYTVQSLTLEGKLDIEYGVSHTITKSKETEVRIKDYGDGIVNNVIETFGDKTPSDLELIATALFAARSISPVNSQSVTLGVKKIKGDKYSDTQIEDAIEQINTFRNFNINI